MARFVAADKLYVGMGSGLTGRSNEFYSFNTNTKEWNPVSDFGGKPMSGAVSVVFGDRAYVGFEGGFEQTFWEYSATNDVWTEKSSPFSPIDRVKRVLMAVSINDKAYFLFNVFFVMQLWQYDPSSDTWTRKADFTGEIQGLNPNIATPLLSFSVSGKGYFSDDDGNIWEYNPALDQWKTIPAPPNRSSFQFGVTINDRIFLGSRNDVYMYIPE
jgi:N-acetylneuraminic acid mutarotase